MFGDGGGHGGHAGGGHHGGDCGSGHHHSGDGGWWWSSGGGNGTTYAPYTGEDRGRSGGGKGEPLSKKQLITLCVVAAVAVGGVMAYNHFKRKQEQAPSVAHSR